jgi:hypothetical protein
VAAWFCIDFFNKDPRVILRRIRIFAYIRFFNNDKAAMLSVIEWLIPWPCTITSLYLPVLRERSAERQQSFSWTYIYRQILFGIFGVPFPHLDPSLVMADYNLSFRP